MKKLIIIITLSLILFGCISTQAKFIIPDEPKYRSVAGYPVPGGVCMDDDGMTILEQNIMAMKEYSDKLRKILKDLQKPER